MRNPLLAPEVRELLQEGKTQDLVSVLQEMHPTDAAAILSALDDGEVAMTLGLLPLEMERDVFGYLEPDVQERYVLGAGRDRVKQVLMSMLSDDRAEFSTSCADGSAGAAAQFWSRGSRAPTFG